MDADPDTNRKPSDHNIVVCRPISVINNVNARVSRKVQTINDSGIRKIKNWLIMEEWEAISHAKTTNQKAKVFQTLLIEKY